MPAKYHRVAAIALSIAIVLAAVGLVAARVLPGLLGWGLDAQGLPTGPVTAAFVRARPESHLSYPGARLFQALSAGETGTGDNRAAAYAGGIYITPDDPDKVSAWFNRTLMVSGWSAPAGASPLAGEVSTVRYRRGHRETLAVGIDNSALARAVLGPGSPAGQTVFEYRYSIIPYGAPAGP